jgi:tRNA-(ms[2]io[6]A)-hydroxylase
LEREPRKKRILDTAELPLLCDTPARWAPLAADNLQVFMADHAVCEQQAALSALNLVAHYPEDEELVERMTSLAIEEVTHLRRVAGLLRRRGFCPSRRRSNPFVRALHDRIERGREPTLKLDRLLVGALIEARSCERFTRLLEVIEDQDRELATLLQDLGPAERRHWEMFYSLAARDTDPGALAPRWRGWLEYERDLTSAAGLRPTVHG